MNNRIDSRDLFTGTRDIVILHGNDAYHLRLTAQNKLILTKRTCLCVVCPID
jgi:hemin uptake protein HemP